MISKCTNCKKYIYYFLEGALALVIIIGLTLKMTTKEDTWLCENGRWIKHGNPSAEMPKTGCGELKEDKVVTNFLECEAAGYPVMKSYPRQCQVKDMIFVEEVGITDEAEKSKANLVKLESVHAGDSITSPIKITGEARGNWFFEASFPISIVNWDGLIIGQGVAQAKGEWMTEGFVPFEANISFDKATYKNNGSIILQKDNPSGLPENDDALEIPIFFK
ncbi:MAG: hypothetical protein UR94_C0008G0009 [Parcubacteria group bacterium GW2011_GWA2_36_10]|nr:MAG: hypothetical protein UR94_C0008G0009 [Parcubacteria group bacterium GW2011_GWA2_36_10]